MKLAFALIKVHLIHIVLLHPFSHFAFQLVFLWLALQLSVVSKVEKEKLTFLLVPLLVYNLNRILYYFYTPCYFLFIQTDWLPKPNFAKLIFDYNIWHSF